MLLPIKIGAPISFPMKSVVSKQIVNNCQPLRDLNGNMIEPLEPPLIGLPPIKKPPRPDGGILDKNA